MILKKNLEKKIFKEKKNIFIEKKKFQAKNLKIFFFTLWLPNNAQFVHIFSKQVKQ